MAINEGQLGERYTFEEQWEIRLIRILGVLGNQKKEFRCGENGNRTQGEQELSFAHRNNMAKAQFKN